MKFFQADFEYFHPWDNVTTAIWKKYPNEKTNHVLSVDTLTETVDPETGILTVERLLTCRQSVPYLFKQIVKGSDVSYVHEISVIDPKNKIFDANSINLSFSNYLCIEESVNYKVDPLSPSKTLFHQQAQISAPGLVSQLAGYLEDASISRFKNNSAVGREALSSVLERLFESKDRQPV